AHIEGVKAFNRRLARKGFAFQFPESPVPLWLPPLDGIPVYREYFVAVEGDTVRGTYALKPQAFYVRGKPVMSACLQLPLSGRIVPPRCGVLGGRVSRAAWPRRPRVSARGRGGPPQPLPRLLKAMKWCLVEVPFYFRVVHPFRFLREIAILRNRPARRLL